MNFFVVVVWLHNVIVMCVCGKVCNILVGTRFPHKDRNILWGHLDGSHKENFI